ncbi:hypothetical protein [Streptomyces sp. NPDC002889]
MYPHSSPPHRRFGRPDAEGETVPLSKDKLLALLTSLEEKL